DFLSANYSAEYFRYHVSHFEAVAKDGWPCWAFSNHDVVRHVSRWRGHVSDERRLAKLTASLLLSLRGSVCLYEGEELGLTEVELAYEDLVDPYGIRLWPEFKGRDGCRVPMAWEGDDPNGGFTTGRPWLPVSAEHLERAADRQIGDAGSVLAHYRRLLRFRKGEPALVKGSITFLENAALENAALQNAALENAAPEAGEVLAFVRRHEGHGILCVFNLSEAPAAFRLADGAVPPPAAGLGFHGRVEGDTILLDGLDAFFGRIS
ncbi:MAG TPA: alpha-amylase family glycosyl hydrolase, partial [Arenibaculum sp.]|nr:alpha-amylase family glycosyl hydrolase [Arenibaculum sp.]